MELDSLFHERKKLNDELVASVSGAAEKWGLQVTLPPSLLNCFLGKIASFASI